MRQTFHQHRNTRRKLTHCLVFNADGRRMMEDQNVALEFPARLRLNHRVNHHHTLPQLRTLELQPHTHRQHNGARKFLEATQNTSHTYCKHQLKNKTNFQKKQVQSCGTLDSVFGTSDSVFSTKNVCLINVCIINIIRRSTFVYLSIAIQYNALHDNTVYLMQCNYPLN